MSEWGSAVVRIGDSVAWTSTDLRVVAMDLTRPDASPYVLEATAAAVWQEIAAEGPLSADALVHNLAQAFDVEHAEIRPDLEALLADLESRDLLVTATAEGNE